MISQSAVKNFYQIGVCHKFSRPIDTPSSVMFNIFYSNSFITDEKNKRVESALKVAINLAYSNKENCCSTIPIINLLLTGVDIPDKQSDYVQSVSQIVKVLMDDSLNNKDMFVDMLVLAFFDSAMSGSSDEEILSLNLAKNRILTYFKIEENHYKITKNNGEFSITHITTNTTISAFIGSQYANSYYLELPHPNNHLINTTYKTFAILDKDGKRQNISNGWYIQDRQREGYKTNKKIIKSDVLTISQNPERNVIKKSTDRASANNSNITDADIIKKRLVLFSKIFEELRQKKLEHILLIPFLMHDGKLIMEKGSKPLTPIIHAINTVCLVYKSGRLILQYLKPDILFDPDSVKELLNALNIVLSVGCIVTDINYLSGNNIFISLKGAIQIIDLDGMRIIASTSNQQYVQKDLEVLSIAVNGLFARVGASCIVSIGCNATGNIYFNLNDINRQNINSNVFYRSNYSDIAKLTIKAPTLLQASCFYQKNDVLAYLILSPWFNREKYDSLNDGELFALDDLIFLTIDLPDNCKDFAMNQHSKEEAQAFVSSLAQ